MQFDKGNTSGEPLDYPLTEIPADDGTSRLVSPRIGVNALDAPEPPCHDSEEFIDGQRDMYRLAQDVSAGVFPWWFMTKHGLGDTVPGPLKDHLGRDWWIGNGDSAVNGQDPDPQKYAELVRMDKPSDFAVVLLDWLLANGATWKADALPHDEFIYKIVLFEKLVSDLIFEGFDKAVFPTKWFFGGPRPEELAGFNVTHYQPEGSPCHADTYPGHSFTSAAGVAVCVVMLDIPEHLVDETYRAGRWFAQGRAIARMHPAWSNREGFKASLKWCFDWLSENTPPPPNQDTAA